jgi:hypothetical protein
MFYGCTDLCQNSLIKLCAEQLVLNTSFNFVLLILSTAARILNERRDKVQAEGLEQCCLHLASYQSRPGTSFRVGYMAGI